MIHDARGELPTPVETPPPLTSTTVRAWAIRCLEQIVCAGKEVREGCNQIERAPLEKIAHIPHTDGDGPAGVPEENPR